MTHFDVFNGDADGICALHQLRLAAPKESVLVSGVKRDIGLLARVDAHDGDTVSVLDVSAAANRDALVALLDRGVRVEYFDHHNPGDLPQHPHLAATIETAAGVCTGMLVDRHLGGRFRAWAIVAAFGDNLGREAEFLAATLALDDAQRDGLRAVGEALAYNSYGDVEADLIVHPVALYRTLEPYADPFEFIRAEPIWRTIRERRQADFEKARLAPPAFVFAGATVHILPSAPWSRRVRGAFANELANASPDVAHAVLSPNVAGGYVVSLRTPRDHRIPADALARKFGGDGRKAAAGIDRLPQDQLGEFVRALELSVR
jgi:hypothetical protein